MASFFDNLADKVNSLGNKVVEKTTSSTENIRLSNAIKEEERQINEDYLAIGKKYRELFGASPEPAFADFISDIVRREAVIEENRKKIQKNKGKTTCTNCGTEIDSTAAFCDKCGTKNPVADEIAREKAEAEAKAAAEAAAQAQAKAEAEAHAAQAAAEAAAANAASVAAQAQAAADTAAQIQPDSSSAGTETVFCKNCGSAITDGNVFCTNCGTRIDG